MTLMCIERSQSPTHNGTFLQGRKSPPMKNNNNNNNSINNNNNNVHQQNANNNHHHNRRSSVSPPLPKSQQQQPLDSNKNHESNSSRKLERSCSEPADRRSVPSNSSRYKTELCRPFEESGSCKYGDKCQFAHGPKELRTMARHPKYKTELCRTFHSTGLCPYGPRCHFIHNSEQSRKSLISNLARPSLGSAGDISPPPATPCKSFTFDWPFPTSTNNTNFSFSPVLEYPLTEQQPPHYEESSDSSEPWFQLGGSAFAPFLPDDLFISRLANGNGFSRIPTH